MSESSKEVLNIFADKAGDPTLLGNRKCWRADSRSNSIKACRSRLLRVLSPANGDVSKFALEEA